MRRRVALLLVVAGALASAASATLGGSATQVRDSPAGIAALARAELTDVPAPTAMARVRDGVARDHDVRRDLSAALAVAFALVLTGAWWLARERVARVRRPRPLTARRTRAPPGMPATVHC